MVDPDRGELQELVGMAGTRSGYLPQRIDRPWPELRQIGT